MPRILLVSLVVVASCSGSTGGEDPDGDASAADDGGADEPDAGDVPSVDAPAPPVAPALLPCPDGWVEAADPGGGPTTCEPWPDSSPVVLEPCPEGWVPASDSGGGLPTCDPWPASSPVVATSCPTGWRLRTDASTGTATCEPWPGDGPETCATDEAHLPGTPGCATVGTPCTADDWATGLPATGVRYVRSGAAGGDGSRGSPFGTILEAVAAASPGDVIALSKGTFDEATVLPGSVTLWGACTAQTTLTCSAASESSATVAAGGTDVTIRNLRVSGERLGVRAAGADRALRLTDVIVDGAVGHGVMVASGARLDVEGLVVLGTRPQPSDDGFGRGVNVQSGAAAVISRGVVSGSREVGVFADGAGTSVELYDVAVLDTHGRASDLHLGIGVDAQGGATARLERCAIERATSVAFAAGGTGTTGSLTDVVLRETTGREADGAAGRGIEAWNGPVVTGSRVTVERAREYGVLSSGVGTRVELTDAVVRDGLGRVSDGGVGIGVLIQDGGAAAMTRAALERNRHFAVIAGGAGATADLTDAVLRDTLPRASDDAGGGGLSLYEGAVVTGTRVLLERNAYIGVAVDEAGTSLTLTDAVVRDTGARADGRFGRGCNVQNGAQATLTRVVVERSRELGVAAIDPGTIVRLNDAVIRDTLGRQDDGSGGYGLWLDAGAEVEASAVELRRNRLLAVSTGGAGTHLALSDVAVRDTLGRSVGNLGGRALDVAAGSAVDGERVLLERNREVGVIVYGAGASLTLSRLVVRDTLPQDSDGGGGSGLVANEGASVTLSRAVFERNRLVAVHLANGADVTLTDLVVRDTDSEVMDRNWGVGLLAWGGTQATVTRAVFERNRYGGVGAMDVGTMVRLEDLVVRDTRSGELDGTSGRGVGVEDGATVEIERGVLERNREVSVMAIGAGSTARLIDVVVADTRAADCGAGACAGYAGGVGIGSSGGALVEATRFEVAGAALCGLQLGYGEDERGTAYVVGGEADLSEGQVYGNPIGVNVQTEGFDIARLMDRVAYHDNERNFDSTTLPVPSGSPLPGW